jgi:hypothetical protein
LIESDDVMIEVIYRLIWRSGAGAPCAPGAEIVR